MKPLLVLLLLAPRSLISQRDYPVPTPRATSAQAGLEQAREIPAVTREELEQGIKHVLVSQVEAWNHGKLEAYMDGYWRSSDLTFFSGATVTKGWEPTMERYRQRYQSSGREMGHLEFEDLNIELLSRRSAVVTGKWQLTMSDGKLPHGLFTLLFKRFPTGWRIVHDHTSAAAGS